jgi:hypothetical protein
MPTQIKSQQELHEQFVTALQEQAPDLTDTREGSMIDTLAGVVSFAATEINRLIVDKFNKTYFNTAHGPEVTGGDDDLETLAVDHFGDTFARPEASKATGVVTFSRANDDAGDCTIPAGTIVKTAPNANGVAQRFETAAEVVMTGLSINASVEALVAGEEGNAQAGAVTEIESALTDSSIEVTNADAFAGGEPEQDDATYRETIRNQIESLRGATLEAIESKALTVAGVETATGIETEKPVIAYDIGADDIEAGAEYFRIPYVTLYIADANGTASDLLIADVQDAIESVRAAGVRIDVQAATGIVFDWTAAITLNPAGPNYATLSSDPSQILESMREYINELAIGADFDKSDADDAILAIWGPAGTNDLTAFATTIPSGDVAVGADQKLVAGDLELA